MIRSSDCKDMACLGYNANCKKCCDNPYEEVIKICSIADVSGQLSGIYLLGFKNQDNKSH